NTIKQTTTYKFRQVLQPDKLVLSWHPKGLFPVRLLPRAISKPYVKQSIWRPESTSLLRPSPRRRFGMNFKKEKTEPLHWSFRRALPVLISRTVSLPGFHRTHQSRKIPYWN